MNDSATLEAPSKVTAASFPPQPVQAQVSPTLMQFFIRPVSGDKFTSDFGMHLHESGFEWHPRLHGIAALLASDDKGVIATLQTNRNSCFHGWTECIVAIDPHNCARDFNTGERLVKALRLYATAHGGALFDGMGKRLDGDEIDGLQEHLAVISRKRWAEGFPKRERLADGSYAQCSPLSFTRERYSKRGKYLGMNAFDIDEPANRAEGWEKGLEMCRELMTFQRDHNVRMMPLGEVLAAAMQAQQPEVRKERPYTAVAAQALVHALGEMVKFAATRAQLDSYFDAEVAHSRKIESRWAEVEANQKAARVERLAKARSAKKAKQQGGAA